ncbi:MAG: Uma2 family endonuclease [Cyanobacteria bacterium RM1_2_2]|nr:Uma2 family endonuclease [Cyanobacteria bacterium RM1_2_2]
MTAITLNLNPLGQLTDEAFSAICEANPEIKFERTADGALVIMSPTGGETGNRNSKLTARLEIWAEADSTGLTFDSSTCFKLPNGAERSPDAAWVSLARWNALTPEQRRSFPPLAPDFVAELRSASDSLEALQAKMREYVANGVQLGWLLDPQNQRVEVYRPGQSAEVLNSPESLSGEEVLPSFVLRLDEFFDLRQPNRLQPGQPEAIGFTSSTHRLGSSASKSGSLLL